MKYSNCFLTVICVLLWGVGFTQQPKIVLPTGHTDQIHSCNFSPDSKYVLTGSSDGTSKVWETSTGRLLHTLEGTSPFYSADGKYIVTTINWKDTRIWNAKTGELLHQMAGHSAEIILEGKWIMTIHEVSIEVFYKNTPIATSLRSCKIWDIETGAPVHSLLMNQGDGTPYVYVSPSGDHLVTLVDHEGTETEFKLYSLKTGSLLFEEGGIYFRNFSPDGRYLSIYTSYLYSKQEPWRIKLFEIQNEGLKLKLDGPELLEFSPDGKVLITANSSTYAVLDANSLETIFNSTSNPIEGDEIRRLIISPDSRDLFVLRDKRAERITLNTFKNQALQSVLITENEAADYDPVQFKFIPDSRKVILQKNREKPEIWDLDELKKIGEFDVQVGNSNNSKDPLLFRPGANAVFIDRSVDISDYEPDKPKPMWSIWSIEDQKATHLFPNTLFNISPNGRYAAIMADPLTDNESKKSYGFQVIIRDLNTGKDQPLIGVTNVLDDVSFHSIGKYFKLRINESNYSKRGNDLIFESANGNLIYSTIGTTQFLPNSEMFVFRSDDQLEIRSCVTLETIKTLPMSYSEKWGIKPNGEVYLSDTDYAFSSDGRYTASLLFEDEGVIDVWDNSNETLLFTLNPKLQSMGGNALVIQFSKDNSTLITHSTLDSKIYLTQIKNRKSRLLDVKEWINSVTISPDNTHLLISTFRSSELVDFRKDERLRAIPSIGTPFFSETGDTFFVSQSEGVVVYSITGKQERTIAIPGFELKDINFKTGRGLASRGPDLKMFDINTGENLLHLTFVDSANWVVTHPSGLFDATPGAMDKLYFVAGMETVELSQLKARYFEPGLWEKVLSGQKLRQVIGLNELSLPPEIILGQVDSQGQIRVEVLNRGGGIGMITLYINAKEAISDLRPFGTDPNAGSLIVTVPVAGQKGLLSGKENFLAVKGWNSEQWIESKGVVVGYRAPTKAEIKPAIHIIACGVSDYMGDEIDLKYAAKDAEDMVNALSIASKRLFGVSKSFVYSLTTNQQNALPTKENILKTFAKVAATASVDDVIVLYLSGHGINVGGADGDFYYLTQNAYTASLSAYNDPGIRNQTTISSNELVELFKTIPALKQVMIIDACASGKVVDNLIEKRNIESGTLRALDRMKDRTGMHIITGCAADAVSYEAGRYGQGVLTYSLLEGMRGLALRDDKFADIVKLFQFAQERVPVLASGIGGIQQPRVFSPQGSQSFDIGELTSEDKLNIPLAKAKQIFIRSNFIDELKFKDALGLGKKIDETLSGIAAKGNAAPLLFVDVSEYPDACQLSGLYKYQENKIQLKLNVTCAGQEVTHQLEAIDEKELIEKIISVISVAQ